MSVCVCVCEGVRDLLSSVNIDLSAYVTQLARHLAGRYMQSLTHSPANIINVRQVALTTSPQAGMVVH